MDCRGSLAGAVGRGWCTTAASIPRFLVSIARIGAPGMPLAESWPVSGGRRITLPCRAATPAPRRPLTPPLLLGRTTPTRPTWATCPALVGAGASGASDVRKRSMESPPAVITALCLRVLQGVVHAGPRIQAQGQKDLVGTSLSTMPVLGSALASTVSSTGQLRSKACFLLLSTTCTALRGVLYIYKA